MLNDENNNNAVNVIFDVLQKEYESEEARNKQLETKVQIMLAGSTILVSGITQLLKPAYENTGGSIIVKITSGLLTLTVFIVLYAIYELLNALKIRGFEKINHNVISNLDMVVLEECDVKANLIQDYNESINVNGVVIKDKVKAIKAGSNLLEVAIILFGLSLSFMWYSKM